MEGEVNAVKKAQNATDQYSRRNSFLLHKLKNIPVHLKGIKFAMWVANELNRRLCGLSHEITYHDIDAAHPLPNRKDPEAPPTVVVVKFVSRNTRNMLYYKKGQLKFSNDDVSITEHLTHYNGEVLRKAKTKFGKQNAWSDQCKLFVSCGGKRVEIETKEDVEKLAVPEEHLELCEEARSKYQEKRKARKKKTSEHRSRKGVPSSYAQIPPQLQTRAPLPGNAPAPQGFYGGNNNWQNPQYSNPEGNFSNFTTYAHNYNEQFPPNTANTSG